MKRYKLYLLAGLLMMVWLLPLTAGAEERKDEWKKTDYMFDQILVVYVETEFGDKVQADDLKRLILTDKVREVFLKSSQLQRTGFMFLSKEELENRLSAASGENIAALAQSAPAKYRQLLKEGAAFYCQGILQVRFGIYHDTVRHIPEHLEPYETTKQVHINRTVTTTNGSTATIDEWVAVPVNEVRVIAASDEITAHTSIELTLLDTKNNQPVWKLIDSRDAVDKDKDGMINRTLQRAAERFSAIKKS